jgi:hypothetical protein
MRKNPYPEFPAALKFTHNNHPCRLYVRILYPSVLQRFQAKLTERQFASAHSYARTASSLELSILYSFGH